MITQQSFTLSQYSCLDLLPQSFETLLRDKKVIRSILLTLLLVIDVLIESQEAFYLDYTYTLFDPHVGENSCQIRAGILTYFAQTQLISRETVQKKMRLWSEKKVIASHLLANLDAKAPSVLPINILELLKQHKLLFVVNEVDKFLFECLFLTIFKKEVRASNRTVIDHFSLQERSSLSIKAVKKLTRYYQMDLSQYCCETIVRWAQTLGFHYKHVNMLRQLIRIDDDGRSVLPCFFSMEIILEHLKRHQTPILLVLHNTHRTSSPLCMRFDYDIRQTAYQFRSYFHDAIEAQDCCFVVHAETEMSFASEQERESLVALIEKNSLSKIFLSYMAVHPQYSGQKLAPFSCNPLKTIAPDGLTYHRLWFRYQRAKNSGVQMGCHQGNKSFIFIEHIFSDTFAHQSHIHCLPNQQYAFVGNLTCWEVVPYVT